MNFVVSAFSLMNEAARIEHCTHLMPSDATQPKWTATYRSLHYYLSFYSMYHCYPVQLQRLFSIVMVARFFPLSVFGCFFLFHPAICCATATPPVDDADTFIHADV